MRKRSIIAAFLIACVLAIPAITRSATVKDQILFGAQMAKKGNWLEALFRWQKALEADPENFRLYNNCAVAYEALGKYEEADKAYREALKYSKNKKEIQENYYLFTRFYSAQKDDDRERYKKESDRNDTSPDDGD